MRAWRPGVCLSTGMLPLRCAGLARCTTGGAWLATLTSRSTLAHSPFPPLSVCELPHSLVSCRLVARSCAEQSVQESFSALVSGCNMMTSSITGNAKHHQALCHMHVALMKILRALLKRSSTTASSSAISTPFLTRAPACTQCSTLHNSTCLA